MFQSGSKIAFQNCSSSKSQRYFRQMLFQLDHIQFLIETSLNKQPYTNRTKSHKSSVPTTDSRFSRRQSSTDKSKVSLSSSKQPLSAIKTRKNQNIFNKIEPFQLQAGQINLTKPSVKNKKSKNEKDVKKETFKYRKTRKPLKNKEKENSESFMGITLLKISQLENEFEKCLMDKKGKKTEQKEQLSQRMIDISYRISKIKNQSKINSQRKIR